MDINAAKENRIEYNNKLKELDNFFVEFSNLDTIVYQENIISKHNKELIGLAISLVSRCNECILYHLEECLKTGVSEQEIIEVIKMSIIGAGSITLPNARYALKSLEELKKYNSI